MKTLKKKAQACTHWREGSLPSPHTPAHPAIHGHRQALKLTGGRILLVEDEEMVRDILQTVLENRGWRVVTASDGHQAIEAWQAETYDLVLMDIQMPGMDGLEATQMIRKSEGETSRVPIIALTARGTYEDEIMCLRAGMDDYLAKPLRLERLFTLIDKHVGNEQAH